MTFFVIVGIADERVFSFVVVVERQYWLRIKVVVIIIIQSLIRIIG